jgi:hypothetical protein
LRDDRFGRRRSRFGRRSFPRRRRVRVILALGLDENLELGKLPLHLVAQPALRRGAQVRAKRLARLSIFFQLPPREPEPVEQLRRLLLLPRRLVLARSLGHAAQRFGALGPGPMRGRCSQK